MMMLRITLDQMKQEMLQAFSAYQLKEFADLEKLVTEVITETNVEEEIKKLARQMLRDKIREKVSNQLNALLNESAIHDLTKRSVRSVIRSSDRERKESQLKSMGWLDGGEEQSEQWVYGGFNRSAPAAYKKEVLKVVSTGNKTLSFKQAWNLHRKLKAKYLD